jgi:hypothetical protein
MHSPVGLGLARRPCTYCTVEREAQPYDGSWVASCNPMTFCADGVHLCPLMNRYIQSQNFLAFMPLDIFRRTSLTNPVAVAQIQRNCMPTYIDRRFTLYKNTA